MAAIKRLANHLARPNKLSSPSSSSSSALFISTRGIASKLFIGGLSFATTEKGLTEAFSQHGQVVEAKIPMDRVSGKSKGFGFVSFASADEAEIAMQELNGKPLNGRVIFVDYARPSLSDFGGGGGIPIARGPPIRDSGD